MSDLETKAIDLIIQQYEIDIITEALLKEEPELKEQLYYDMYCCGIASINEPVRDIEHIHELLSQISQDDEFLIIRKPNKWYTQTYRLNGKNSFEIGEVLEDNIVGLNRYMSAEKDYFFMKDTVRTLMINWCARHEKPLSDETIELW